MGAAFRSIAQPRSLSMSMVTQMLKAFTPVGQEKEEFKGTNFMGQGFTYLPEDKRKDLYGYNPKKDAELGADDNVLGNVPFLMAFGNKTTNKENAPYHGTFPAHFTSY